MYLKYITLAIVYRGFESIIRHHICVIVYGKHTIITKKLKSKKQNKNEKQNKSKSDNKWSEIDPMSTFYICTQQIYPRSYNVSSFITKLKQMRYF